MKDILEQINEVLKESNFIDIVIKELEELTDNNAHTEWLVLASERLNLSRDLVDAAQDLVNQHEVSGSMTAELMKTREELVKRILVEIKRLYGKERAEEVNATR